MPKRKLPDFDTVTSGLPAKAAELLKRLHHSNEFRGTIESDQALELARLMGVDIVHLMAQLVPLAALYAAPVISGFHVGGIGLGISGKLYYGANLEIGGGPLIWTLHGEQSVVMNAWLHGERSLRAIVLSDAPCGYCRQFLYELRNGAALKIGVKGRPLIALRNLLPRPFGPRELKMSAGLMGHEHHKLVLDRPSSDPLIHAALSAARASYAPYTQAYAGVAILAGGNRVFSGRYAENAAYNPSVSPLMAALSQMKLTKVNFKTITRAVLVQARSEKTSQVEISQGMLRSIGRIKLKTCVAQRGG